MKIIFLFLFLIFTGCSSYEAEAQIDSIKLLQEIWNSKDLSLALKKIQGLHKVSEGEDYETFGTDKKISIFSLVINVSKKDKKIISIRVPLDKGNDIPSNIVKAKLATDDWKTYEHPISGIDAIKLDVSEYSEKLGVGFAYDKLDKEKRARMIYWGGNFKRVQTLF
jgi:hypothetical protein